MAKERTVLLLLQLLCLFLAVQADGEERMPPQIVEPVTKTDMVEAAGVNLTIKCRASGIPAPEYKWFKGDAVVSQDTSRDTYFNHSSGDLHITRLKVGQEGDYACHATNWFTNGQPAVAMSSDVKVTVGRVETWNKGPATTLTAIEGDYKAIPCDPALPAFYGPTFFKWYTINPQDEQTELPPNNRYFIDSKGTLQFTYVERTDASGDTYACALSNAVFGSIVIGRKVTLNVTPRATGIPDSKPVLRYPTSSDFTVTAIRGQQGEMECFFSGYTSEGDHLPEIKWENSAGTVITSEGRFIISEGGHVLTINNVEKGDEQLYTCRASNTQGSASYNINFNVTSSPMWVDPLVPTTVPQGEDAVLRCKARSYSDEIQPGPPRWLRNGNTFATTNINKYEFQDGRTTLIVKNVNKNTDIACYQCFVSNSVEEVFGNACLNVILPIVITHEPETWQDIQEDPIVNLTVMATSDPLAPVDYRWVFRNVTYPDNEFPPYVIHDTDSNVAYINASRLSEEAKDNITGEYRCIVFNKYQNKTVSTMVSMSEEPGPAAAGFPWWIIIVVLLVVLLILAIIIICCVICRRKMQEGDYPVDKKETASGLDPEREAKEGFPPLSSAHVDYYPDNKGKQPISEMDGHSLRDDESIGTGYGDDASMAFNEDGSFIGEYKSNKKNPATNPAYQPTESNV